MAAHILRDDVGIGHDVWSCNPQLEPRAAQHVAVGIDRLDRGCHGQHVHILQVARLVAARAQDGVVEPVLVLAVGDVISELEWQVELQLVHRHGGQGYPARIHVARVQDERAVLGGYPMLAHRIAQQLGHGFKRRYTPVFHQVVRHFLDGYLRNRLAVADRQLQVPGSDVDTGVCLSHARLFPSMAHYKAGGTAQRAQ